MYCCVVPRFKPAWTNSLKQPIPVSPFWLPKRREFIELNEWQIHELKAAIKEAEANDFSSNQEVNAVINKWGANAD